MDGAAAKKRRGAGAVPAHLALAAACDQRLGALATSHVELLLTAEAPGVLHLPDALVTGAAAALEAGAALLCAASCGVLDREPFLTLADSRKVLRHNYYSSAVAAADLGVPRVTWPADAAREMLAAARAAGASGVVAVPPAAVWLAVVGGLALTAAMAADVGGMLHAAVAAACEHLPAAAAACGPVPHTAAVAIAARVLTAILRGALLCHALQGVVAFALALARGKAALAWGLQSAVLGFPSTSLLVSACGLDARAVPAACVSCFVACTLAAAAAAAALV